MSKLRGEGPTTATRYTSPTLDLQYGLATVTIADPTGLALETKLGYEEPGATG